MTTSSLCLFFGLWIVAEASSGGEKDGRKETNAREYCRWEVLNATCPHTSVVLMRSALYGRMKTSRCTELDYYVGCSYDALKEMDQYCSGKRRCDVSVPIPDLHELQPCPKDLQTYLEADFTCIPVHTGHTCPHKQAIKIEAIEEGYLSSHVTDESSQGSRSCPWQLVAARGQRINLTLYDFNLAQKGKVIASAGDSTNCLMYGIVKEANQKEQTICARNSRITQVYVSRSNVLEITFVKQNKEDSPMRFLIKYEVTGCPDPDTPPTSFTILERTGNSLTISCATNEHQLISHLTCHRRRWIGDIRNCSETSSLNGVSDFFTDSDIYTHGLIVSIVTGILLGVIVGACLLFAVLAYRKKRHYRAQHNGKRDLHLDKKDKQHTLRFSDQQIRKVVPQEDVCNPALTELGCNFRNAHNKQTTPLYVRHGPQQQQQQQQHQQHQQQQQQLQTCDFFRHHLDDVRAPCKIEHPLADKCVAGGEVKLTDYGFVSDGVEKECEAESCVQSNDHGHRCHGTLLPALLPPHPHPHPHHHHRGHYDAPGYQKNFMPFDIIEN